MIDLADRYRDQIYRPGEDIGDLDQLSDEEQVQRFEEIEAAFAEANKPLPNPGDPDFDPEHVSFVKVGISE
jgi:hypothetical protein